MSSYTKIVNYAAKDSLVEGDPNKIIKGTELDAEFVAIQTAITSKADLVSPVFTGAPRAPTASFGDNSTKLATTAFVQQALQAIYPVGSIYINASSSTNPATIFGFGTWTAFGEGKVLIGLQSSDTLFDTLGETGGSKDSVVVEHTHTFTSGTESATHTHSGTTGGESVSHTHSFSGTADANGGHTHDLTDPGHSHGISIRVSSGGADGGWANSWTGQASGSTTSAQTNITMSTVASHTHSFAGTTEAQSLDHTHTITTGNNSATHTHSGTTASSGVAAANTNIQPYIVVKMWQRTA